MQEGKRQKQVAGLIQEEVNDIFRRLGMSMMDGGMVSVSSVKVTPDLLEVRIYLSFFQVTDPKATMKKITERGWEVKRELAARIAKQVRRMPELRFFYDDTLDHVFKMEDIFNQIKKDDEARDQGTKEEGGKENT
ncbi:30S ribosome-binding factor RbfA [Flaviaesturariibacter amylovorans]|uniref:Ribosome-binding factor A n=1 Tax=Flaviaesturariibacter amylovorans TaxID=1084520 RepID=A0ABP8H8H9_9BACT